MPMKLKWLPEPSSRGGWLGGHARGSSHNDNDEYQGFDRFGTIRATVTYVEHPYLPSKWRISNLPVVAGESYEVSQAKESRPTKIEAMLLAESFVEDEEAPCT